VGLLQLSWLLADQQWQQAAGKLADYEAVFAEEIASRGGLRAQIDQIRDALISAGAL